jgi:hypothetical protein
MSTLDWRPNVEVSVSSICYRVISRLQRLVPLHHLYSYTAQLSIVAPLPMLCETCKNIFRGTFSTESLVHHETWQDLQRSAMEECAICLALWDMEFAVAADTREAFMFIHENTDRGVTRRYFLSDDDCRGIERADIDKVLTFSADARNGYRHISGFNLKSLDSMLGKS